MPLCENCYKLAESFHCDVIKKGYRLWYDKLKLNEKCDRCGVIKK